MSDESIEKKYSREELSALREAAETGDAEAQYKLGVYFFNTENNERAQWRGFTYLKHAAKAGHAAAQAKVEEISHSVGKDSPFFHERVFHEHDMLIFDRAQELLRGEVLSGNKNDDLNMMKVTSFCAMAALSFKMSPEGFCKIDGENEQTGVAYAEIAGILYELAPSMPAGGVCRMLGEWYLSGEHVERDIERGYFWLERSAQWGDEDAAKFLEKEVFAVGSSKMEGLKQWVLFGYPACVTALMGEYWLAHRNKNDGLIAIQTAAQKGDSVAACRVAKLLWDKDRAVAMRLIKNAYEHDTNLELMMLMGRVSEEEGDYARAYNLYYNSYAAGLSEGLYRQACLLYDGKVKLGDTEGKQEAAAWLRHADDVRAPRINRNSYIYPARRENFPKTNWAALCTKKLEEDEAFREKYGACTLDEMVEQAKANGDIDIE